MIIGARRGTTAHTKLQEDKIRIFDVIDKVNDSTCSELHTPMTDPQQKFDQHLNKYAVVTLHLSHTVSLPSISRLLAKGTYYVL